jgi:glutathione S-transferase
MRTLYHLWLSPQSRKVRVALKEKGLDFELRVEKVWERREAFLALNPSGDVPVLVEEDGSFVCDAQAICEYLEEVYDGRPIIGDDPASRAETRRLVAWFDYKFGREVTENLVGEKVMKRFMGMGAPNAAAIRAAQTNLHTHLAYIAFLTERRKWLAGDNFSLADIAAGAQVSCVDYLGDVPWDEHPQAKDWYVRIKSRPSFRPLLGDHIPGLPPPKQYADLDF